MMPDGDDDKFLGLLVLSLDDTSANQLIASSRSGSVGGLAI